jgi:sugar lactone lactonase YvrE
VADNANTCIRKVTASGVVTTLAGSVNYGYADGTGAAAQFNLPEGVAVDASGNVYVADTGNNCIRKVTAAGVVTTLAGSVTNGFADGTGAAAQFNSPSGVAVDASGNVYVADTYNNCIRKVTAAGVVTTLAGSVNYGYADGTGAAAQFSSPYGVAVDASGNVYVADSGNNCIRMVTAAGVVTTLAGSLYAGSADGTNAAARFNYPVGVAVDASGNVYVADFGNNCIRKVTAAGVVTTLAGSTEGYADGTGMAAQFNLPSGVAVDANGNVYVADYGNNCIRKVTATGVVTTLAGSVNYGYADGTGAAAMFYYPEGVAVDASGNVYVADTYNYYIRKVTAAGVNSILAKRDLTGTDSVNVSLSVTGLVAQTTYYFRAVATNNAVSANGEILSFTTTTNHPPVAAVLTLTQTANVPLMLALSDLATNWSDIDGDPVSLVSINFTSTNGATVYPLNLTTNLDGSYVITNLSLLGFVNPAKLNDQISYTISDGLGDSTVGLINIVVSFDALTGQVTGIISSFNNNSVTLSFAGVPGYTYAVERSTNLPTWTPIWTNTAPAGSFFNFTDTFGDLGGIAPSSAFYRLSWTPPHPAP